MRKSDFAYAKTTAQIGCAVTAQLISTFVFASQIVQSLYFKNLKFQAASHLLCLYSLVCGTKSETPKRFSHNAAHIIKTKQIDLRKKNVTPTVFCYIYI